MILKPRPRPLYQSCHLRTSSLGHDPHPRYMPFIHASHHLYPPTYLTPILGFGMQTMRHTSHTPALSEGYSEKVNLLDQLHQSLLLTVSCIISESSLAGTNRRRLIGRSATCRDLRFSISYHTGISWRRPRQLLASFISAHKALSFFSIFGPVHVE